MRCQMIVTDVCVERGSPPRDVVQLKPVDEGLHSHLRDMALVLGPGQSLPPVGTVMDVEVTPR